MAPPLAPPHLVGPPSPPVEPGAGGDRRGERQPVDHQGRAECGEQPAKPLMARREVRAC